MTNFTETHKHSVVICSLDSLIWIHGAPGPTLVCISHPLNYCLFIGYRQQEFRATQFEIFFNYSKQNKIKNLLFLLLQHSLVHI